LFAFTNVKENTQTPESMNNGSKGNALRISTKTKCNANPRVNIYMRKNGKEGNEKTNPSHCHIWGNDAGWEGGGQNNRGPFNSFPKRNIYSICLKKNCNNYIQCRQRLFLWFLTNSSIPGMAQNALVWFYTPIKHRHVPAFAHAVGHRTKLIHYLVMSG
jgi:hypothetical protein